MTKEHKEISIRTVRKALFVLQAINQHGALTLTQISQIVKFPQASTWRIVCTLVDEGFIERELSRKYYRVTALVQSLSYGYQGEMSIVAIARKHIVKLTSETGWPVSLVSRFGPVMIIRDSTHSMTTKTFSEYHPGYSLPILSSASGLAYLAFTDNEERAQVLHEIEQMLPNNKNAEGIKNISDDIFELIVRDGYASFTRNNYTKDPGKTSSLAVPLYRRQVLVGVMTLVFFSNSMGVSDAFDLYKTQILSAQAEIINDLDAMKSFKHNYTYF